MPEEERHVVAMSAAIIVGIVMFVAWGVIFFYSPNGGLSRMKNSTSAQVAAPALSGIGNDIKTIVTDTKKTLNQLKTNVREDASLINPAMLENKNTPVGDMGNMDDVDKQINQATDNFIKVYVDKDGEIQF